MIRIYLWKAAFYNALLKTIEFVVDGIVSVADRGGDAAEAARLANKDSAIYAAVAKHRERIAQVFKERDYAMGVSNHWLGVAEMRQDEGRELIEDFEEEVAKLLK